MEMLSVTAVLVTTRVSPMGPVAVNGPAGRVACRRRARPTCEDPSSLAMAWRAQPEDGLWNPAEFLERLEEVIDAAFRLAVVMLRDEAAAEEAVFRAALSAARRRPSREAPSFRAWFLALVASETGRVRLRGLLPGGGPVGPESAESEAETAAWAEAWRSLDGLGKGDRLALFCFFYLRLPMSEIATVLRTSVRGARRRIHRAVRRRLPDGGAGGDVGRGRPSVAQGRFRGGHAPGPARPPGADPAGPGGVGAGFASAPGEAGSPDRVGRAGRGGAGRARGRRPREPVVDGTAGRIAGGRRPRAGGARAEAGADAGSRHAHPSRCDPHPRPHPDPDPDSHPGARPDPGDAGPGAGSRLLLRPSQRGRGRRPAGHGARRLPSHLRPLRDAVRRPRAAIPGRPPGLDGGDRAAGGEQLRLLPARAAHRLRRPAGRLAAGGGRRDDRVGAPARPSGVPARVHAERPLAFGRRRAARLTRRRRGSDGPLRRQLSRGSSRTSRPLATRQAGLTAGAARPPPTLPVRGRGSPPRSGGRSAPHPLPLQPVGRYLPVDAGPQDRGGRSRSRPDRRSASGGGGRAGTEMSPPERGLMDVRRALEEIDQRAEAGRWEDLLEFARSFCTDHSGETVARRIALVDLRGYVEQLEVAAERSARLAGVGEVQAVCFRYDPRDRWRGLFVACRSYAPRSAGDDRWLRDWTQVVRGPTLPAFAELYLPDYRSAPQAAGRMVYLVARTVESLARATRRWPQELPLCAGFPDQVLVTRIREPGAAGRPGRQHRALPGPAA